MDRKYKMNDGDWVCSDASCGNVNFARRTSCNRCDRDREDSHQSQKKKLCTEIGKAAAEKSKGLFSADDWQCNKCGNVNWARRNSCNMCNAPKFGEVEERTGYGGGYNERGVVEYIKRDDSDDEYDEFGRKKKTKQGNGRERDVDSERKNDQKDKKIDAGKGEEDEDDDEEEDDEDLSKYDLSDWGAEGAAGAGTSTTQQDSESTKRDVQQRQKHSKAHSQSKLKSKSHSASRSRSRSSSRSGSSSSHSSSHSRSGSSSHTRSRGRSRDRILSQPKDRVDRRSRSSRSSSRSSSDSRTFTSKTKYQSTGNVR